ncbi:MAG: hypothetical protein IPH86_08450 [bacterium]|nr:hypothetical protein [bacterium]
MLATTNFVYAADRTVIGELWSADGLTLYCPFRGRGDSRICIQRTVTGSLWHHYLTSPWRTSFGDTRFSTYGFRGTPSVMFDGTASYVGGQACGSMFPSYQPTVASKLGTSSPWR